MPPDTRGAVLAPAPPGPAGYPVVGVFPMARRDPLAFFLACARRYGDLVRLRFGVRDVYLLRHPDDVKRVLQDPARDYAKGPSAARVRALFGESLTLVDGDRWRRRRRQVQPAFRSHEQARVVDAATHAASEMLDRWRPVAERGEPIEIASEMRRLTQAIIVRALFGEIAPAEARTLADALDAVVTQVDRRLWSPLGWLGMPTAAAARCRRARGVIDAVVARRLAEARCEGAPPEGMLAALLDGGAERLTTAELRDECRALLIAGHTTTASALAWIWYVLSEHPAARERIARECHAVLEGRAPALTDLARLDFTSRVIDEVLRLYPPTWITARTAIDDAELGRYRIRGGTLLLLSPYLTHRHPAFWDEPERFDPDRFTPGRSAGRPAFAYFPFGAGPRHCIGSALARAEMQAIVATVAQRCRLELLRGTRVTPVAGLVLRPHGALPMRVRTMPSGE